MFVVSFCSCHTAPSSLTPSHIHTSTSIHQGESKRRGGVNDDDDDNDDDADDDNRVPPPPRSLPEHVMLELLREYVVTVSQVGGGDVVDDVVTLLVAATRMPWATEPAVPLHEQIAAATTTKGTVTPAALGYAGLKAM